MYIYLFICLFHRIIKKSLFPSRSVTHCVQISRAALKKCLFINRGHEDLFVTGFCIFKLMELEILVSTQQKSWQMQIFILICKYL